MDTNTMAIVLSVLAFAAIFTMVYAIGMPKHPNKTPRAVNRVQRPTRWPTLQAKLDAAQIEVSADSYVRQSLQLGIPIGIGLFVLVGAIILFPVGVFAGFLFTWSKLEQERDVAQIKYFKQLASACDIITNAYAVRPSLVRSLQSAGEFTASPLREDFQELIIGMRQGEFELVVERLADKRKSIVFDSVANALIRAKDESGQVKDIMEKLANSTRMNVSAFEEAVSMQLNARSSIRWGTYGPWMIFGVFRGVTLFMAMSGTDAFSSANAFFTQIEGNILTLIAAFISIALYVYGFRLSQRGLVVKRVSGAEAAVNTAQGAKSGGSGSSGSDSGPSKRPGRWKTGGAAKPPVQIPVAPDSA
jgi:Type II secretion system (T2SS), protein F